MKEIARTVEVKETVTSKKGFGHIAASGSNVENNGGKKIVGYADDGDALGGPEDQDRVRRGQYVAHVRGRRRTRKSLRRRRSVRGFFSRQA